MRTNAKVRGVIHKEALGIPGLDEVLISLGFGPDQIGMVRTGLTEDGSYYFSRSDQEVVDYVGANTPTIMLHAIRTDIVFSDVFEAGDTVTLKSGGVVMTVSKVDTADKTADLIWNMIGSYGSMSCAFKVPFACLVPADPPA